MEKLNIDGRLVGPGEPPYFIAEIGANHNGDMHLCRELIDAAKRSGADAVKFQSWSKESLISRAEYARNTAYADKHKHFGSLEAMVEEYQLTREQHYEVAEYCKRAQITFLSSSFSPREVDLLVECGVPCFKIASMDINHIPLLSYTASKGKPVILSTGMADLGEIEQAIRVLKENGSGPIALLHCVSIYPPRYENINLRNIETLRTAFDLPVGFSDHTLGTAVPLAAIALGSCIVEKHFTLDRTLPGWDHSVSADPNDLDYLCSEGRNIFASLGSWKRAVGHDELRKRLSFRRRIVTSNAKKKGDTLCAEDLAFKRPGNGIHPNEVKYVLGRTLTEDIGEDEGLEWHHLK